MRHTPDRRWENTSDRKQIKSNNSLPQEEVHYPLPDNYWNIGKFCNGDYYYSQTIGDNARWQESELPDSGAVEIGYEKSGDLSDRIGKITKDTFIDNTSYQYFFTSQNSNPVPASETTQTNNSNPSNISPASPSVTASNNIRTIYGTLQADTFTFDSAYDTTVIFGNGNVKFGKEGLDVIDLSNIASSAVSFNYANNPGGGVIYNTGKVNSLFDAITFGDGKKIYFQGVDAVRFADTTINLSVVPNDTLFSQQWNLHMMGVHNAWRFTTGNNNVAIGVQDTGLAVDANGNLHPDLRNSILDSNNYIAEPTYISHGTSTQSIIAAKSNNGMGISGINWGSPVYHADVIGGEAGDFSLAYATERLIAQAQGKPLIINLSLTGGDNIESLVANNQERVLFVAAAGNENQNSLSYPANLAQKYGNVIAVGASWGDRDWFGNLQTPGQRIFYQGSWGSNYGDGLTGMAPSEVPAASASQSQSGSADFNYHYYSNDPNIIPFYGTSASTPHVSGIASLVWSANLGLTASQVKGILANTAYDLGAPGYDTEYGYGFFNADAAVRAAIAMSRTV